MRRKLRIAVAGAGAFGREHLRALASMDRIEIVGVADIDEAAARAAAEQFGAGPAETGAIAMIERLSPDGVIIATPGHTHVELALAALRLDIPVLLEKPVALSEAGAEILIEAERRSSAFVLPGHILRFSEPYRLVAAIARSGDIGRILSVSVRNHRDETHATRYPDIDPVLMTMVHDIDLALWITGAPLASVLALRHPEGMSRSETLVTAVGAGGVMWHMSSAWTYPTLRIPADRVEVIGDNGAVELELGRHLRVFGHKPRDLVLSAEPDNGMLPAEISYFADCIEHDRKPGIVTLEDARLGLRAADAIDESLRTGGVVSA